MKIENLEVGSTIKNYKELCKLLGVKPKSGNAKIAQHKEFNRYFEYEKEGNKYIITKIYNNVRNKVDKRGGNNTMFSDDFEKIMVYMLYNKSNNNDKCSIILSKGNLLKATNLVNENYDLCKNNISKLSEIIQVSEQAINEFYNYNNKKLYDTVERNLRKLKASKVIDYNKSKIVVVRELNVLATNELNKPIFNSEGKLLYDSSLIHRVATEEERRMILEYEKEVLKNMNCKNEIEAYLKGKWKQYKSNVEKMLEYMNTNIQFYYNGYDIIWSKNIIDDLYNEYFVNDPNIVNNQNNINKNIIKSIKTSTTKRHNKALNHKTMDYLNIDNEYKIKQLEYQAREEYIQEQEQITFSLIDKKAECFKDRIVIDGTNKTVIKIDVELTEEKVLEQLEIDLWNSAIPF